MLLKEGELFLKPLILPEGQGPTPIAVSNEDILHARDAYYIAGLIEVRARTDELKNLGIPFTPLGILSTQLS